MHQPEHPDTLSHHTQVKSITRGGTKAAEDKAMEAMWRVLERGASKEEVERVFFETFNKVRNGMDKH